jgi:hypothetical protein
VGGGDDGASRTRRHTQVIVANLVTPFRAMVGAHIARARMIFALM